MRHPNLSCGGATASHASALETKTAKSLVRPADYAILSTIMLRYKWHLCIMLLMTWSCRPGDSVPDQLIGTWQTATAAHAGSSMEITKQLLVFTSNRGDDVRCRIVRFRTFIERSQTIHQMSYQDQYKNEYQLYLLYDPADGGTVKLKNQPELVWKRVGALL